ncbi:GMC family oxidoreductase N-terminal domain-containing protein [uncultured Roseibium sp.]|uniref:GMC family oxidoreductase n=1 Tax=uncultured Roseibium sp. TaxID=1936171 RepID=UPI00262E2C74|nr:GMC family oxidoreductase N-terminal domain-containing protein [uncultured Roseibium sp.]
MSVPSRPSWYDYVVVGGGVAGTIVAGRLAERGSKVCLLEAGKSDRHSLVRIPAGFSQLMSSEHVAYYRLQTQAGLDGRTIDLPQGRVLGGGGSINAMVYIRGQAEDYEAWEQAAGKEWSFESLLPYFKSIEANSRGADAFHGTDGPVGVSDLTYISPLAQRFRQACLELGHPDNDDFNGKTQAGVGYCQITARDNRRSTFSLERFEQPGTKRNLDIRLQTSATRIIVEDGRAVGVECMRGNDPAKVMACREVVLTAGAIETPKLLMLSGIGPTSHLKGIGIETIADLPDVGSNLQDHCETAVIHAAWKSEDIGYYREQTGLRRILNVAKYLLYRTGPLTSNGIEAHCFWSSSSQQGRPDLQLQFLPLAYLKKPGRPPELHPGGSLYAALLRPQSRGHVKLASANWQEQALVDPRYLDHPGDIRTLLAGLRQARKIMAHPALSSVLGEEQRPGPSAAGDEDLLSYIRSTAKSVYHPVGTCRMGSDSRSVVDPQLGVRGLSGLRIADASIMPALTSGNTAAPTMMIAEKAVAVLN